jgi:AcrR family transcriptional regulator
MSCEGVRVPADTPAQLPPGLDLLWGRRERGRRGPRPELSPDAIVAAAMRVADAEGLEAVSMARVAKELGFTTMSLYRHVANKDELLQLMWNASAVGAETLVLEGSGWRERLKSWALVQRDALDQHPWITQMPLAAPPVAPNSMHFVERALEAMDDSGLPDDDKLRVIGLITSYTLSEARMAYDAARAIAQAGPGQVIATQAPPGEDESAPRATTWTWDALLRELVDEKTYPRLYRVAWSPGQAESPDEHAEFLFGLDRILDGIQALVDRQRRLRLRAVPGPVRDRQAARHVGVVRVGQRQVTDRPFHVGAQRGAEFLVPRQPGVVGRAEEALHEPAPQVRHVSHPRVHVYEAGLVAAPVLRIARRPAHHLGPVRGEPLHVLRILPRVRERVVQFRIRQAPRVVRGSQPQERRVPAREFIQRRLHAPIMAHIFERS